MFLIHKFSKQGLGPINSQNMKLRFSPMLFALLTAFLFCACDKQEATVSSISETGLNYFSTGDISSIKNWYLKQKDLRPGKIRWDDFPEVNFHPAPSSSDSARIRFYSNGIMYANDDAMHGKKANYNRIAEMVRQDKLLGKNGKIHLLSMIQLSMEVFASPEIIKHFNNGVKTELRDNICCNGYLNASVIYEGYCRIFGGASGYCTLALFYEVLYYSCLEDDPTVQCPYGFEFDGANCYSGVHFPSGYTGFVLGNGFYTQQNCSISTANDCCPPGFAFDGANCHYWELYFPSEYEGFVLNNTFYVKPICE